MAGTLTTLHCCTRPTSIWDRHPAFNRSFTALSVHDCGLWRHTFPPAHYCN